MRIKAFRLLFLLSLSLLAQKIDNTVSFRNIEKDRYFRFHYDNDYFAATDENYTQGYSFELVLPSLEKHPINHLFFKPKAVSTKYGLSIEHIGFTPNDYVSEAIQVGDRPFAAAIMLKSFTIATDTLSKTRMSQALSFGLIGTGAFGKEMQVGIHEATGNKIPKGWDNQIKNDVVTNYRIDFGKQVYRYHNLFGLEANASAQLGTLFTNVSLGFKVQVGILNSAYDNPKNKKNFQVYVYGQPALSAIGYDASFQGGIFINKIPYIISTNNLKRFTVQYDYGLSCKNQNLLFRIYPICNH